jgi:hypothetical protein
VQLHVLYFLLLLLGFKPYTLYICVPYDSHTKKQALFPYTLLSDWSSLWKHTACSVMYEQNIYVLNLLNEVKVKCKRSSIASLKGFRETKPTGDYRLKWACIYIHTCIHTYMQAYMHTYIHAYVRVHIHTCMHTYMHIHTYMHTLLNFLIN